MSVFITQPMEYWASGGPLLFVLAVVCFGIWFYLLRTRSVLVYSLKTNRENEEKTLRRMSSGPEELFKTELPRSDGIVHSIAASALRDIREGAPPDKAFEENTTEPLRKLSGDIKVISALTASAPLLGLLGTVMGMIETFSAVSSAGGETAGRVADGISKALITTQFGLVIAIPGMLGVSQLHRLVERVKMRLAIYRIHAIMGLARIIQAR